MPITREEFLPLNYQAFIFTEKIDVRADRILKWLPGPWASRLPEPLVLPTADLPPELPRISWQKEQKPWSAGVAPVCFSVAWRNWLVLNDTKINLGYFLSKSLPILLAYKRYFKVRVSRIAFTCSRFARQKNPAKLLAEHFCKPAWIASPFNRPENFEIHSHKVFDLPGSQKINSWMHIRTAQLTGDAPPSALVIVAEQDFNTVGEISSNQNYTENDISRFFRASAKEIDKVLDRYFPVDVR
jgi:hypothetical protein